MPVGIEALNFYGGPAYIDVSSIFKARGLDLERFDNLMMLRKSVGLPCEDPVTNGVNAAKPIVDRLNAEEKSRIDLVITASESGLDFGKSLSTYIHDYLGLHRNCRLFEIKQACYGGTAALHMASSYIAAGSSPGAKALVIATDVARAAAKQSYGEPSQAVGAIAMLISDNPEIMELDLGANGYYSYEVMDAYRPLPDIETGDSDLSLLSYLDCLENSFKNYQEKVDGADFATTFDYLAFHTPFAGMVKGGHRQMMRRISGIGINEIEADFERRVAPSLHYCVQVGNVYSATVYLALCSLIEHAAFDGLRRVGLFSYGSGCSSEFYSGIVSPRSKTKLEEMQIEKELAKRYPLGMAEYDRLLDVNLEWLFGTMDKEMNQDSFAPIYDHFFQDRGLLVLKRIRNYHREYDWS